MSINDWAAKAARRISDEFPDTYRVHNGEVGGRAYYDEMERVWPDAKIERAAAIIATFVEPLVALLWEARREHNTGCLAYSNYQPPYEDCTCGADEWNAKVDAALNGTDATT